MTSSTIIRGTTLAISALVLCVLQAQAQGNAATSVTFQITDPCRATVSRFEQTIGFIRQAQGNTAAAELKEKLLPAKTENSILLKDGYCGLASYLNEKKLVR